MLTLSSAASKLAEVLATPLNPDSSSSVTLKDYVDCNSKDSKAGCFFKQISELLSKGIIIDNRMLRQFYSDHPDGLKSMIRNISEINKEISDQIKHTLSSLSQIKELKGQSKKLKETTKGMFNALRGFESSREELEKEHALSKTHHYQLKIFHQRMKAAEHKFSTLRSFDATHLRNCPQNVLADDFTIFAIEKETLLTPYNFLEYYQEFINHLAFRYLHLQINDENLDNYLEFCNSYQVIKKAPKIFVEIINELIEELPTDDVFYPVNRAFREKQLIHLDQGQAIHGKLILSKEMQKKGGSEQARNCWQNQKILVEELLSQIPNIRIKTETPVNIDFGISLYNNYGLKLDAKPIFDLERGVTITVDGKEYLILEKNNPELYRNKRPPYFYEEKSKQLFPLIAQQVMCDAIAHPNKLASTKTITFCDGCGCGNHTKKSAEDAAIAAQKHTESSIFTKENLKEIAALQIHSILHAHNKITSSLATTTISQLTIAENWLVATTLGDNKIFVIKKNNGSYSCFDITAASGENSESDHDPGGRLGAFDIAPNSNAPYPDLRNLTTRIIRLKEGDRVIVCSHGTASNFDPKILGQSPNAFERSEADWDNTNEQHIKLRSETTILNLLQCLKDPSSLSEISKSLREYLAKTVEKNLIDLIQHPKKAKHERSKEESSGNPDHAAHIIIGYEGIQAEK